MPPLRALFGALLLLIFPVTGHAATEPPRLISMGTGAVAGVYFPVGIALCRLVNQDRPIHGIRCAARPTEGSLDNLRDLRAGKLQLGLAQSDTETAALKGTGPFAEVGPDPDLRAVMALYPEPLTIVARRDAGIARIEDLAGKRVAIGAPGSGQRALMDALMTQLGWTTASFASATELAPQYLAAGICAGTLDAFVFVAGSPAQVIQEATTSCDTILVPATGPAVDALLAADPAYFATTIPAGFYRGTPTATPTFGVGATLLTRADLPEEEVYVMVKSIFEDFDTLIGLNPVLTHLDRRDMTHLGLTAPLHPGAARYYREQGWLP